MPKTLDEIFRFCQYYYYNDGIIGTVVDKLSSYAITDFVFTTEDGILLDQKIHDQIDDIFAELKIKELVLQIGLDYNIFGNAFIVAMDKFRRKFKCTSCKKLSDLNEYKDVKIQNWVGTGECPKCKKHVRLEPKDIKLMKNNLKFSTISVNELVSRYNTFSDETLWFRQIDEVSRRSLEKGDKFMWETTPMKFIEAAKKKTAVKMSKYEMFHFKNRTLSGWNRAYGKPLIQRVLKDLFQMQVVKKAQEALSLERVMPLDIIFPGANQDGSADGYGVGIDQRTFRNTMEQELEKFRRDPGHKMIAGHAVGKVTIGGDGKNFNQFSELSEYYKNIVVMLGIPQELLFGGMSWSSSSVSLRIMENDFINYRHKMEEFLNDFILPKIKQSYKIKDKIKVKFSKFKMGDDANYMNMMMQLAMSDKVSLGKFLEEMGYGSMEEEIGSMKKDFENLLDLEQYKQQAQKQAMENVQTEEQIIQDPNEPSQDNQSNQDTGAKKTQPKPKPKPKTDTQKVSPQQIEYMKKRLQKMAPEEQRSILEDIKKQHPKVYKELTT